MGFQRENKELDGEVKQLISFMVGEEEFGLEILKIKEVIRIQQITKLPKAPSFVKGVINLRGDVIPVIDLREKFGLEGKDYGSMTRVIVVEVGGKSIGMVVDSVSQVIRVPIDQIEPAPPMVGGLAAEYLEGVAKMEDRLIILVRIDKILSMDEKIELKKMEKEAVL